MSKVGMCPEEDNSRKEKRINNNNISSLESLDSEPLADIIHDQALEDDLVAALVHTNLCTGVGCQQVRLQCLLYRIKTKQKAY
jgi:hypothetical protein